MNTRRCTKCGYARPVDQFTTSTSNADGISSWCLHCYRESNRRREEAQPGYGAKVRARWLAKPGNAERNRDIIKAKERARARLAKAHPDEYADLLDEERAALGLPPANRKMILR